MIYLSFCYKLLQVNWDPRTTQTPLNWDPSWFRPPRLRRLPIQNPLFYLKSWVTGGTEIQLIFSGQNDLILSLGALREKIESYWPKMWSHWRNWNSTELFRSKWLKLFSQCTERKKLSHCDLKSWVTGWTKIRPNFSGQSESIFFSVCTPSQKIESFWPKEFSRIQVLPVTQLFRAIWLNFFSQYTERKNWVILTWKNGSNFSSASDSTIKVKMGGLKQEGSELGGSELGGVWIRVVWIGWVWVVQGSELTCS